MFKNLPAHLNDKTLNAGYKQVDVLPLNNQALRTSVIVNS